MTVDPIYLVDSDVFITAKNLYYSFKICPGFWKSLLHHHRAGRVYSIDQVRNELLPPGRKTEDLVVWLKNEVPDDFFLRVDTIEVMDAYRDIMMWAQGQAKYSGNAKKNFATGADGWLVAYAQTHDAIVVTNEQSAPEAKNNIKLPDVCTQFGVQSINTFAMLRTLEVRFDWADEQVGRTRTMD
ncbi:MAG: DUF4411 family protein [Bacteroidetes bacterium]|nr:DUF4411 family protein [Bacteroidota bacterium]